MRLIQNVVVALDFGQQTESVINASVRLAEKFGSEQHLLHVLPGTEDVSGLDTELVEMARQGAQTALRQGADRLQTQGVTVARSEVVQGSAFDQIIRYADVFDANVIVVGAGNETGPDAARVGVTTERLCRKSIKPIWIAGPDNRQEPRSLFCPVDYSAPSVRALKNAIHLARGFGAELSVLHVSAPPVPIGGLIASEDAAEEQKRLEAATTRLEHFLEDFNFHGVSCRRLVRCGSPADVIVQVAGELAADLIVMGSVGRTGLSRILLGNIAGRVVRRLPCSMIMVKAEDAIKVKIDEELTDLATHYRHGCELLENGFFDEARRQFERCTHTADLYPPAWHGLAQIYEHQGQTDQAADCRETARKIEEALAWQRVEADIRRSHPLWNKSVK